ncbi:MAG: hypothetical protein A2275_14235 [Bacteroidetes bacterium RIFOXYA12_FULL_35_11]|nr:MAG: hypothetical protein A2X01_15990 [Bacteroidetes bacterium GWF2_35_48]OFY83523.1 MAG: hypothetical protein A2275_14235 [Bacteroidetes bacterium RIFOXYA12_FULL_35_11]OFY99651.1 MAG: hypothetical protein A2491_09970 [Bacteroidetes bacterium RIFOXYC12_FULL_35_7]HBX50829.1 DUF1858 domain-containing protein [Bacteroidales bacterium]
MREIDKKITIKELIEQYPFFIEYLLKRGIHCIRCGEPVEDMLEDSFKEKGFGEAGIEFLIKEMNNIVKENKSTIKN